MEDACAIMDILKKSLKRASKLECTTDMLYGKTTYFTIVDEMSTRKMYKRGRQLIDDYGLDPMVAHKCMIIYMGNTGNIEYKYKDIFPEANDMITQVGNILREYHSLVQKTKELYNMIKDVDEIPEYKIDAVTVISELSPKLDLSRLFDSLDIYPFDVIMEVTRGQGVRRKISVEYPPKDISRRYVKPSLVTKPSYLLLRLAKKDITVYDNSISLVRNRGEETVDSYIREVVNVLPNGISITSTLEINTRVYFAHSYNWHRRVMAYVISSYEPFMELIRNVDFYSHPYDNPERELLSARIKLLGTKCTFKNRTVSISDAMSDTDIICSIAIVTKLFWLYDQMFSDVYQHLSGKTSVPKAPKGKKVYIHRGSKIDFLRSQLPELFVKNYTRECHCLPVMLDNKEDANGRSVIRYPKDGKYARWYTSPSDDLYVGLKINRLSNKNMFKYIVVCYTSDHMLNSSKRTYQYYNDGDTINAHRYKRDIKTLKVLDVERQGPIPRTMEAEYGVYDYKRVGTGGTLISCLEYALDIKISTEDLEGKYNVLRQELWNIPDDLLREQLRSHDLDASVYYRLFEEVYRCNIIVVDVNNQSKYTLSIPHHKSYYIWEPCKYKRYVIILKNVRKLYSNTSISHELIIHKDGARVFPSYDDLVSKLVATKRACTMAPIWDTPIPKEKEIKAQYIDENGKCTLLFLKNGSVLECGTRPYTCPVLPTDQMLQQCSTLYRHMIKYSDNLEWITTTSDYLYFPTDDSFQVWMEL